MKIEVVHTYDEFLTLEQVWKRLVDESDLENPFITYEFFYCLLTVFFKEHELLIFVVKDGEEIIGIAPFFRDNNSIRSISNIHSHYFQFIVKKNSLDVYDYVFRYISKNFKFQNIFLGDICGESDLFNYIVSSNYFPYMLINERASPVLKVSQNWDDYYSSISKNFRENVRKRVNKVAQKGGYLYKACNDIDELEVFLNDLFYIEKNSWKHPVGRSMFSNTEQPAFYSILSKVFFEHVKIEIIYINDDPSAFWLSLIYKNAVYQLKNSFVEESKEFSPGVILTVECLKNYFEKQIKCVDYLGVTNSVKARVSNDFRTAYDVKLYKRNVANYIYISIKYKIWPIIGNNKFSQRIKNLILNKSPEKKVSRETFLKK